MPKAVKEPLARRGEILDAAQRLIYTKGYEQMTIQDIIDELKISKGAFYHYFDSKSALLESLIERMQDNVEEILVPIAHDSQLSALQKFQQFLDMTARWKATQKAYMLALLKVWYTDENALVRQKVTAEMIRRVSPYLREIFQQGIREGSMSTPYPEHAGEVVLSVVQNLGETFAGLLLGGRPTPADLKRVEGVLAAYSDAVERVLGAPPGSLILVDPVVLRDWVE